MLLHILSNIKGSNFCMPITGDISVWQMNCNMKEKCKRTLINRNCDCIQIISNFLNGCRINLLFKSGDTSSNFCGFPRFVQLNQRNRKNWKRCLFHHQLIKVKWKVLHAYQKVYSLPENRKVTSMKWHSKTQGPVL